MPRTRSGAAVSRAALALAALALIAAACGKSHPVAPEAPPSDADTPPIAHGPGASTTPGAPGNSWYVVAEQWVDPGVPSRVSGSRYAVRFRSGSLSTRTEIRIREYDPEVVDFELLPHGTTFRAPVEVTVDYAGTNLDPLSPEYDGGLPIVLWLNPDSELWEVLPGVDNRLTRTYRVRLEHFSRYAMSGSRSGTAEW